MENGYYNTDINKLTVEEFKEIVINQTVKPLKMSELVDLIQTKTKKSFFKKLNKYIKNGNK